MRKWKVTEGVPYAPHVLKSLTMDMIEPAESPAETRGLFLLFVHGGGWDKGDKDSFRPELEHFAGKGYPCASIQYRLSGEAIFPAQWEDVRAALAFVRNRYPRVVLAGHSAGGHLAALAGLAPFPGEREDTTPADAVVGLSGVYDLRYETMKRLGFPFREPAEKLLGGRYADVAVRERAFKASPIEYVDRYASVPASCPRFLLVHGEADEGVPVEQTVEMGERLRGKGLPVSVEFLAGAGHSVLHERRDEVLGMMERFLEDT